MRAVNIPPCCRPYLVWMWQGKAIQGTPRSAVDRYFSRNRVRAERLALALCRKSGSPEGWTWATAVEQKLANDLAFWESRMKFYRERPKDLWRWHPKRPTADFRSPPLPHVGRSGHCQLCGQPIYALGWHQPWGGKPELNKAAGWHAACRTVYYGMIKPAPDQGYDEVDHIVPLYRVYRDHGATAKWPDVLSFWLGGNLQSMTKEQHRAKSAIEARERAEFARTAA